MYGAFQSGAVRGGKIWRLIATSSAGTLIEWYGFYIFGSLATIISQEFFPQHGPVGSLVSILGTFALGFVVRPLGALLFGRIGDIVGRRFAFMMTLLIMGGSTTAIGLLPNYQSIGVLAPILLLAFRLLQGLAVGGEYGGAVVYVAEHAPDGERGFYTGFVQTTATLGLFLSLIVVLVTRVGLGEAAFRTWGWRIPFLISIFLVMIASLLRSSMPETPLFRRMRAAGEISSRPVRETFFQPKNRKLVILSVLGATAGQGVLWYTGQFYALYFLQTVIAIDFVTANLIVAAALLAAAPFFVLFGLLADHWGRKKIMVIGCLVAALSYLPLYHLMVWAAGFEAASGAAPGAPNVAALTLLVFLQVLLAAVVYGPVAAYLVELFPTRIRYTAVSVPYHIGYGVFGGLVPFIGTYLVTETKSIYAGLYYPIAIALVSCVIGALWLPETKHVKFWPESSEEEVSP